MAACTSGSDVSEDTAVPTPTSEASSSSSDDASSAESSDSPATLPTGTAEPTDTTFELPGLVDPSDEAIANDDEVRTGTLDNGLEYYVRHNERPGAKASLRLAIREIVVTLLNTPFATLLKRVASSWLSPDLQVRLGANLAIMVALVIVMMWNFFVNRYWTYNDVQ